ncbi:MAG: hypothetical protein GY906_24685 [bacterium]|nr:hypothetical protein [bacterium]
MSDHRPLETLAREWLSHTDPDEDLPVTLTALLRSRDERALRIVDEFQSRCDKMWKANVGETHDLNKGASIACDEIKRRLEAEDE